MSKNKFTSIPPRTTQSEITEEERKKFVLGAELELIESLLPLASQEVQKKEKEVFPWENPNIRSDVHKTFNLRLPEEYFIKLDYLSKITKESKQRICLDVVMSEIDKRLTIK
jgi:hypothetical protein